MAGRSSSDKSKPGVIRGRKAAGPLTLQAIADGRAAEEGTQGVLADGPGPIRRTARLR